MRWFVVRGSDPEANAPPGIAQAQPPGPGLPEQAPSVKTVVGSGIEPDRRLDVVGPALDGVGVALRRQAAGQDLLAQPRPRRLEAGEVGRGGDPVEPRRVDGAE